MIKEECKKYLAWCKKYHYKPTNYKYLKAYCNLKKGVGVGSTLA